MVKSIEIFTASQAANGLTVVPPASSPTIVINSTNYIRMEKGSKVGTVCGKGANLARIQLLDGLQTPLLDSGAVMALAADPAHEDIIQCPHAFDDDVNLSCNVDNSNNNEYQGVAITKNYMLYLHPAPNVKTRILRITSTTTAVARTWTTCTMVYPSGLPSSGKATVVGMRAYSASGGAMRVILPNGDRVGVPTAHTTGIGPMFYFSEPWALDFGALPSFELNSSTTTAAHTVELAVVY